MGLFGRGPKIAELVPVPPVAELPPAKLQASARYLGTLDESGEKVIGHGLAARSAARLSLSAVALDVVRIAGSFRIPVDALRGASTADRFAGKAVADVLLVRWVHGDQAWQTGFRMEASRTLKDGKTQPQVDAWVRTISKLSRGNA